MSTFRDPISLTVETCSIIGLLKVASSSSPVQMDEAEELGPSPYVRAYPSTYPGPAPPPTGTPRRRRAASVPRRGIKLQRVCT